MTTSTLTPSSSPSSSEASSGSSDPSTAVAAWEDSPQGYRVSSCDLQIPRGWEWDGPRVGLGDTVTVSNLVPRQSLSLTFSRGEVQEGPFAFEWDEDGCFYYARFSVAATREGVSQDVEITYCVTLVNREDFHGLYGCTIGGDPEQVGVWGADQQG